MTDRIARHLKYHPVRQQGLTLIELLVATALAAMLIVGLGGVAGLVADTHTTIEDKNELTRQARFAMAQMVRTVGNSSRLLLPLADVPSSSWRENVREETVPASPPEGSSTKATAVLAVALPRYYDLDGDGVTDADDDGDGRIDEDFRPNRTYSEAAGIYLIDDDGDGEVDEGDRGDDDESGLKNEDPINGIDDDNDGNVDEDPPRDMNADGCSGICGVDDDHDGLVDESSAEDDDEDGQIDEDWINPLVFYLDNGVLMQRTAVPWDEDNNGTVDGQDFIAQPIADNVIRFRVERLPGMVGGDQVIDLTLEVVGPLSGEIVSLHTRVRVGGAL